MNRRRIHLELSKLEDFQNNCNLVQSPFVLFLACDATTFSADVIGDFAGEALKKGMVYFCAWGPDCERVHDVVDEVIVMNNLESRGNTIMTSWHNKESLKEALQFAEWATPVGDDIEETDKDLVVVTVANSAWSKAVNKMLAKFASK
jgi:hypothetical protein